MEDASENAPKRIVLCCLKSTNRYSEDGAQQWVKDYTKDFQLGHATWAASLVPWPDVLPGVW